MIARIVVGMALVATTALGNTQQASQSPLQGMKTREDGPVLRQAVQTGEPFTVAGERGVILGQQQGVFESWVLPVKLLSHMTIEANVDGYPVPIAMNTMARGIEVRPDRTTITYSHIALTIRQTMFAPDDAPDGTGAVVLFEVDAVHPVDLVFRFTADMRKMWPAPSGGPPSAEWVAQGASGLYILHTDLPDLAGAVALPGATYGVMAPYQERPQVHPLEFRLHVDPRTDRGKVYPLLMAVGTTPALATNAALEAKLAELNGKVPALLAANAARYRGEAARLTEIVTPDAALNQAFSWAEVSIGQLKARTLQGEVGLVAGYYASGDSARPGFGWFFGRDSLYTLYALHSYGEFALAKTELEFLLRRQRADGKMMHEYSQTAAEVDWKALPYEYAAADSTPLFLTTLLDYVKRSGDVAFLREHREAVRKAWEFETTHDANGDGIYDNAQGTGWVESWPPGMPKQEIYLALLDEQASRAMSELSHLLGDEATAQSAAQRAETIQKTIEREYFESGQGAYAFSFNDGKQDLTSTVYPAVGWWNGGAGLEHADRELRRWASHDFDTDWGLRDVAASDPMYDGMSYHQGSVWPLFTGWAAVAQYRTGHALAGYQATMQNVDLTTAQDIGAVTELLSGDFYEPFGRSTSHQLWSSAMVVTPVMRGMFGIEVDALNHTVSVKPQLPAGWEKAEVRRLHVGDSVVDLSLERKGMEMVVTLRQVSGAKVQLVGAERDGSAMRLPLPGIEVAVGHGLPQRGARTAQMKVLGEVRGARSLTLDVEGTAGREGALFVRRNDRNAKVSVEGGEMQGDEVTVRFAGGSGYVTQKVTIRW